MDPPLPQSLFVSFLSERFLRSYLSEEKNFITGQLDLVPGIFQHAAEVKALRGWT